jgi:hypothetical protein
MLIKDIQNDFRAVFIAMTVGITGFLTHNLTIGFLTGIVLHYGMNVLDRMDVPFGVKARE